MCYTEEELNRKIRYFLCSLKSYTGQGEYILCVCVCVHAHADCILRVNATMFFL